MGQVGGMFVKIKRNRCHVFSVKKEVFVMEKSERHGYGDGLWVHYYTGYDLYVYVSIKINKKIVRQKRILAEEY